MQKRINDNMTVFLAFKISPSQKQELDNIAKRKDRTMSWIVRQAIKNYIEAERGKAAVS